MRHRYLHFSIAAQFSVCGISSLNYVSQYARSDAYFASKPIWVYNFKEFAVDRGWSGAAPVATAPWAGAEPAIHVRRAKVRPEGSRQAGIAARGDCLLPAWRETARAMVDRSLRDAGNRRRSTAAQARGTVTGHDRPEAVSCRHR
jgi:hypothetical protein